MGVRDDYEGSEAASKRWISSSFFYSPVRLPDSKKITFSEKDPKLLRGDEAGEGAIGKSRNFKVDAPTFDYAGNICLGHRDGEAQMRNLIQLQQRRV